jgi:hypothetical protein
MAKRSPLCIRIYFEPHLTDLIRLIGYGSLPWDEARQRLAPLAAKYGKDRMEAAAQELLEVDRAGQPPMVRLCGAARKAAWQLLGPPPADDPPDGPVSGDVEAHGRTG